MRKTAMRTCRAAPDAGGACSLAAGVRANTAATATDTEGSGGGVTLPSRLG